MPLPSPPMGAQPLITLWMYYPAAFLAVLGLLLLFLALLRDRSRGRQRCPKCWYDMSGNATTPARCPECGHIAQTPAELLKTRRRWLWVLPALLLIAPIFIVAGALHGAKLYYAVMPRWKLVEAASSGGSEVLRYAVRNPDDWGERVVVRGGGKELLSHEDHSISLNGYNHTRETLIDADNNGVKEAVIECYSGGAHCCYRVYIVELRPTGPVIVADIDARNGMGVEQAADSGATGEWFFNIPDQTFDYWKVSHAESPMPAVYYLLKDGELRVALDRMDKPALAPQKFEELVRATRLSAETVGGDRAAVWRAALDLLYAGHEDQAWTLFDRAWSAPTGKAEFLAEFKDQLSKDLWYQDVVAARAAKTAGKPIPPSTVGMSGRAADEAAKPKG